ncbi:MAG: histidine phosphatase family protein [Fulvivirga sp.]|nr:histidine phosphatase family protein [Fulvivirga sp.]
MKTLYLVRHAKSSWDYPELSDEERPLNKRGQRDAPDMGERLAKQGIFPDLMLSSPAKRAFTTCKIIAKQLEYPKEAIQTDKRIYHAGVSTLLKVVRDTDNTWNTLMLFGHNPGFTDFANELTGDDLENIPTCGIYACDFEVDDWHQVSLGNGKRIFYDFPKNKKQ